VIFCALISFRSSPVYYVNRRENRTNHVYSTFRMIIDIILVVMRMGGDV